MQIKTQEESALLKCNVSIKDREDIIAKAEVITNTLPECGLVRLSQILGDKKKGIPPIIPISKSSWWAGVKTGRYPQSVKLSDRCTCWRVEDIRALISRAGS